MKRLSIVLLVVFVVLVAVVYWKLTQQLGHMFAAKPSPL